MPTAADDANLGKYPTRYHKLRAVLRDATRAAVEAGLEDDCIGCRASAALESLLAAHPVDRRGRCRACRRPGWLRRRVCMVYRKADYWLHQPTHRVQAHLAAELGVDLPSQPGTADPEATEVRPRAEPDLSDPPTQPPQTPAGAPTPTAAAGWPDRDRDGVKARPTAPPPGHHHPGVAE